MSLVLFVGVMSGVLAVQPSYGLSAASDPSGSTGNGSQAALKSLYLSEAKKLAVSKSKEYKSIKVKIITKKANYTDAIARINAKKKKLSTFSWTPLLSFNFPTDPGFTEEFDFIFKPISIQAELTDLKHKLNDQLYSIYEKVTNLYVTLYTLQEKIAFNRKLLEEKKKTLERNENRLLIGLANKSDVDSIKKSIEKLEGQIATDETTFMNKKGNLKDMIGLDVRSGYKFLNPYKTAKIERASLNAITDYTLERSQALFEANSTAQLARVTLDQYYEQMVKKYGGYMNSVSSFVQMAKDGREIDGEALKISFDSLIEKIDEKWNGVIRILFIKIPKLWFKGATAGSRYIEDEPYALYNAILDYEGARLDRDGVIKDVKSEVKEAFENVKSLEKTYRNGNKALSEQAKELEQALIRNRMGQLTFDEYTQLQEDYEAAQITVAADLDSYTQALTSLDRLTCGAITTLLSGGGIDAEETVGGDSYLVAEEAKGVNYYIKVLHESNVFVMGLNIPDDFEVELSKYELWVDNTKIDSKPVEETIKHLGLVLDGSETVFLRFFDAGEKMLCDCTIDPTQYSGSVDIITGYSVEESGDNDKQLGTYSIEKNTTTGTVTFTFNVNEKLEGAQAYRITTQNGDVLTGTEKKVGEGMIYLGILQGSESKLNVVVLDKDGKELAKGIPDPETMTVVRIDEGGDK